MALLYQGLSNNGLHRYIDDVTKQTSLVNVEPSATQRVQFEALIKDNFGKTLAPSLPTSDTSNFTKEFVSGQGEGFGYDPAKLDNYNGIMAPGYSGGYYGTAVTPGIDGFNPVTDTLSGTSATVEPPKKSTDKYDFTSLTYPEDLFDPNGKYGSTYMVFYINVQEDSKFAKNNPNLILKDSDSEKGIGSTITRNKVSSVQLGTTLGAIGAISGGIVGQALGINGAVGVGLISGTAVGSAVGAVKNGAGSTDAQKTPDFKFSDIFSKSITRQTKRLKTAIALYTPNELSFKYGMSWDTDNTSILSAGLDVGEALGNIVSEGLDSFMSGGKSASTLDPTKFAPSARNSISGLVLSAATKVGPDGLSALTGVINNPKKEQTFNSVDFRQHQFTFRFWIRNQNEAKSVENIIQQFKYHMHPEFKDGNDYIFLYPSEFDIKFYVDGSESTQFPKLTSCILTDMSTNYTPSGAMNLLKDGKVPEISINLAFKELAILTKDEIAKGY